MKWIAAAALSFALVVPAFAQAPKEDWDAIAKMVSQPTASAPSPTGADDCVKLKDGSCAPVVDDARQMVVKRPGATRVSAPAPTRSAVVDLQFALGSASLTPSAKAKLEEFAAALKKYPSSQPFSIDGHTDSSGAATTNMTLSKARANAVVDFLASEGVPKSRMTARGFGAQHPVPGTAASNPANRRVEIVAL